MFFRKNNLPLFKSPKPKGNSKKPQLESIRNDASFFSRLHVANQSRQGDLGVFFDHENENQKYPPSISEFGDIRHGTKYV